MNTKMTCVHSSSDELVSGDIVIKSGLHSNIQTGTVTSYDPTTHLTKAQIYTIGGDSGAPIFKDIDG
ncbi:MAG: hypothetical protein KGI07_09095, partial [Thaumarchaeota archaeon]|nr:hypothetical protein [Nitrososphaerota archaeon]